MSLCNSKIVYHIVNKDVMDFFYSTNMHISVTTPRTDYYFYETQIYDLYQWVHEYTNILSNIHTHTDFVLIAMKIV